MDGPPGDRTAGAREGSGRSSIPPSQDGARDDSVGRPVDAWCDTCMDVQPHTVVDAGSCRCDECGTRSLLMKPLKGGVHVGPS